VGLYFSGLDFFAGTRCEGLGLPTRSRAISRTALAAVKVFFFLFLPGMGASSHRKSQKCNNRVVPVPRVVRKCVVRILRPRT
jgi:hypothetical protein